MEHVFQIIVILFLLIMIIWFQNKFTSKVFRIYLMIKIYIAFQKRINISQITFAMYTKPLELKNI